MDLIESVEKVQCQTNNGSITVHCRYDHNYPGWLFLLHCVIHLTTNILYTILIPVYIHCTVMVWDELGHFVQRCHVVNVY